MARQCRIIQPTQRVFLGDMSEKKVNGENVLIWRDFERSDQLLNANDLEPQLLNDSQGDFVVEEEEHKENEIASNKSPTRAKSQSVHGSLRKFSSFMKIASASY